MTPSPASVSIAVGDPTMRSVVSGSPKSRDVFATNYRDIAARRLVAFYEWVAYVELTRLATTISHWQDEVLAYHTTGRLPSARR